MTIQAKPRIVKGGFTITDKCVCLILEFSAFGNAKRITDVDAKSSGAVIETDATPARLTVTKKLLESPELDAISKHKGQVTNWVRTRNIASALKGVPILPMKLVDQVDARLMKAKAERKELVELAVAALAGHIKEAKKELGPAFNKADYPDPEEFREQFSMRWRYVTFDTPKNLKEVSAELYKREQEKAEKQWQAIISDVTALLRGEMAGLVEHMLQALTPDPTGKKKRFHATILGEHANGGAGNITDFLKMFEARNITDDAELAKVVSKARALLEGVDADSLKTNEDLAAKVKTGMQSLKQELGKLVKDAPGRAYDL